MRKTTVVPLLFWHDYYYYLFCQTFEILFKICVEFLVKSKVQLSSFEP
jgi:hypothetical protein